MNIATEFCFVTIVKHWINAFKNCVHMNTTFKRVELESPGCSGFRIFYKTFIRRYDGTKKSVCKFSLPMRNWNDWCTACTEIALWTRRSPAVCMMNPMCALIREGRRQRQKKEEEKEKEEEEKEEKEFEFKCPDRAVSRLYNEVWGWHLQSLWVHNFHK